MPMETYPWDSLVSRAPWSVVPELLDLPVVINTRECLAQDCGHRSMMYNNLYIHRSLQI